MSQQNLPTKINAKEWSKVGKVKDAHGLKGDLYVLIFSGEVSWAKKLKKALLVTKAGQLQVLEAEMLKPFKDGLRFKAKEVNDRNQSELLIGAEFYIPPDLLVSAKGDVIYLKEILGFTVFDGDQEIGSIQNFSSNGPQDLLVVESSAKQIYEIPFVEAFIAKLDWNEKKLFMNLPEGLLQLGEE